MKHIFDPQFCSVNKDKTNRNYIVQEVDCLECLERFCKTFFDAKGIHIAKKRLKELKEKK